MNKRRRRGLVLGILSAVVLLGVLAVGLGTQRAYAADGGSEYTTTADMSDEARAAVGGDVKVTVNAPNGALPEGAELCAKLLSDDADTQAVADELDKAEVSYDGFTALDVYFTDADGNEVEPSEAVDVRFELPQGALGDDVDASTLAVQHLAENDKGGGREGRDRGPDRRCRQG
ncbi:hypothetical protein H6A07_05905 [Olsenella uli]|uniref:hypothetical protein n=1 Tax=Olsenella uli TaxID=133926 RepID=UPI00195BF8E6|nr:hypothetical protein [Olsenella uli]MBM6676275.1 hypothetical protein [Olsenella uli]